jgi:endonuclease/exonuclease/phosphatase family metal-dependent hydrolase
MRSPRPLPLTLEAEIPIRKGLSREDMARVRAIKRRRDFEAAADLAAIREDIEDITFAMEYRRSEWPARRPERRFLRAVTWNIERGNRLPAILSFLGDKPEILDCDIVLLNEVDIGMARSGNRNVAKEIANLFGFEYVFGNSYLCLGHGDARDGSSDEDNEVGMHGNAILSRFPIRRAETFSVAITRDKFESSERRLGHKKALWAEIDAPLGKMAAVSVHLDPIGSSEQRAAQMRDVMRTIEARELGPRVLLGGDLNTSTYDMASIPRLLKNVGLKLIRGGFPHAIYHYMHPYELYERSIFEELRAGGFLIEPFNAMDKGTLRYEVGTFDSESKVRDHLPEIAVKVLRYKLRPWNGVAPLKVDWFAGRGLRALKAGEEEEPSGRKSLAPTVFERARWDDVQISDHDPVLVDVAFE